jgi:peptidoglycan/xylan/chitin deacetylase (PgdA/CDA1 family)
VSEPIRVALTFDAEHPDRPAHGEHTASILESLRTAGARGTFFLQGRWVEAYPVMARRVADAGHLIGNHSFYHARLPLLRPGAFATDIRSAERAIVAATGANPRPWFRMPFGTGADKAGLVRSLAELGYRHIGWHVAANEWWRRRSARAVEDAIVEGATAHGDGAIVLLHTWPDPVAAALPAAIARLREANARLVGVDELDLPAGLEPIGEPRPAEAVGAL